MLNNRSVPANVLLPHVVYDDVAAAITWLSNVFGFVEHYRYGDPSHPQGAQVHLGDAWIMLRSARPAWETPSKVGVSTQSLTIFVEDVEAQFQRAKSAGAKIVEEPHETMYGEFQFAAEDFAGHYWLFSRHAKDVSPADWGAHVAKP